MTLAETLMLIALWCGQPVNFSGYSGQMTITPEKIDSCRLDMIRCTNSIPPVSQEMFVTCYKWVRSK